jgi:hypothetical protein
MIAFINHPHADRLDMPLTKGRHAPHKRSWPPTLPLSPGSLREKRRCTNPFAAIAGGTQAPLQFGTGRGGAIRHLQAQSRSGRSPIRLIGYPQANMPLRIWLNFRLDTWPWPGTRLWWLPESHLSGWRFGMRPWLPSARSKKSVPVSSVGLIQPPAQDHGEPRSHTRQFRPRHGQRGRRQGRRQRGEGPLLMVSRLCRPARSLSDSHRLET